MSNFLLLLLRDVNHLLYTWNSGRRGRAALYADWDDLYVQWAGEAVVDVHAQWQGGIAPAEPVEGTLLVVPSIARSKTEHYYWHRPCTQEFAANESAGLCAIRRLRTLCQWHRPRFQQRPCGAVFMSPREPYARMRAEAAGARVRVNMARYGRDGGETSAQLSARACSNSSGRRRTCCGDDAPYRRLVSVSTSAKYADRGSCLPRWWLPLLLVNQEMKPA